MLPIHSRRSTVYSLHVVSSTARARMDIATRGGSSTSGLQGVSLPTGTSELHSWSSLASAHLTQLGPMAPLDRRLHCLAGVKHSQTRACIGNTYHKQAQSRLTTAWQGKGLPTYPHKIPWQEYGVTPLTNA